MDHKLNTYCLEDILVHSLIAKRLEVVPVESGLSSTWATTEDDEFDGVFTRKGFGYPWSTSCHQGHGEKNPPPMAIKIKSHTWLLKIILHIRYRIERPRGWLSSLSQEELFWCLERQAYISSNAPNFISIHSLVKNATPTDQQPSDPPVYRQRHRQRMTQEDQHPQYRDHNHPGTRATCQDEAFDIRDLLWQHRR